MRPISFFLVVGLLVLTPMVHAQTIFEHARGETPVTTGYTTNPDFVRGSVNFLPLLPPPSTSGACRDRISVTWANGRTTTGRVVLDATRSPNEFKIDWLIPLRGIYRLDADRLTICYNPPGSPKAL